MTNEPDGDSGGTLVVAGNLTELKEDLKKALPDINRIMSEREELSAQLNEIKASMEGKGIGRRALMRAYRDTKADPEKRTEEETQYAIAREAFGIPIQDELFGNPAKA